MPKRPSNQRPGPPVALILAIFGIVEAKEIVSEITTQLHHPHTPYDALVGILKMDNTAFAAAGLFTLMLWHTTSHQFHGLFHQKKGAEKPVSTFPNWHVWPRCRTTGFFEVSMFKVKLGYEDQFIKASQMGRAVLRKAQDCRSVRLSHCIDEPQFYQLVVRWRENRDHEETIAFEAVVKPFIVSTVRHRFGLVKRTYPGPWSH